MMNTYEQRMIALVAIQIRTLGTFIIPEAVSNINAYFDEYYKAQNSDSSPLEDQDMTYILPLFWFMLVFENEALRLSKLVKKTTGTIDYPFYDLMKLLNMFLVSIGLEEKVSISMIKKYFSIKVHENGMSVENILQIQKFIRNGLKIILLKDTDQDLENHVDHIAHISLKIRDCVRAVALKISTIKPDDSLLEHWLNVDFEEWIALVKPSVIGAFES